MISVTDTFTSIQHHVLTLPAETISLHDALGRVLREPVRADRDFPPFDRVSMDGIGIRFSDFGTGQRTFPVAGMQRAGQPQLTLTEPNACLEVMTGAMLPVGVDTVIRYEDVTITNGKAVINLDELERGQNVHARATDRQAGDELLSPGTRIGPSELAVAASVGKLTVAVTSMPRVALISTGDELVDIADVPLPYQIRRSNTYMLRAALAGLGIPATLHHIVDDEDMLQNELAHLLSQNDVLILSGGVSAGKADFVPDVLTRLGVQKHVHKVAQRPGKPLWFGTLPSDETTTAKPVFALPGNPVSTVLCACRYVLPYLRASLGLPLAPVQFAQLVAPVTFRPDLTYFLPVSLTSAPDGRLLAQPLPGSGSADFANFTAANGFLELPPERAEFSKGEAFPVWGM